MPNPWRYPPAENLSAFEPNRLYLNRGGFRLVDATWISGAGTEADGRGALVGDLDGDLQPDLVARNIGGGSVQVFLNRMPPAPRLVVSLEGTRSNRLGVGARVVAEVGGKRLVRELFPANNYACQQGSFVEFGLDRAERVDRLTVAWPSDAVTELRDLPARRHIRIREASPGYVVIAEGRAAAR